jgi:hypothetical protein
MQTNIYIQDAGKSRRPMNFRRRNGTMIELCTGDEAGESDGWIDII